MSTKYICCNETCNEDLTEQVRAACKEQEKHPTIVEEPVIVQCPKCQTQCEFPCKG